jgi:hypothetical protein
MNEYSLSKLLAVPQTALPFQTSIHVSTNGGSISISFFSWLKFAVAKVKSGIGFSSKPSEAHLLLRMMDELDLNTALSPFG